MQKITPHLWFDTQAREAAEFYSSLYPNSAITNVTTLSGTPSGDCDVVSFKLAGQSFMAISAGPLFRFNPSVSFQVRCSREEEVDALWERLSQGGKVLMPLDRYPFSARYGWLEDRYGLSWQLMHTAATEIGQTIIPALMFVGGISGKAEAAINSYVSIFRSAPGGTGSEDTKAEVLARYGTGEEPDAAGTTRYARFWLRGYEFAAMDSAREHKFAFNEAVSFLVPCDTQDEIDYLWEKLSADPNAGQCGWLKDKYGLSWQIVPVTMGELLAGGDKKSIDRVTQAFLKMKKFDIAALTRAAAG